MITKGLVVLPTQGFANRLKMIASSYIYASMIDIPLYICWDKVNECNIAYDQIFQCIPNISTVLFEDVKKSNYCYFGRVHTNTIFRSIEAVIEDKDNEYEYILIEGGHEFKHDKLSRIEFISKKCSFYNSIQFTEPILSKVDSYINSNFDFFSQKHKVVIHHRNIIEEYDSLDVKHNSVVHFDNNSPIEAFCKYIRMIKLSECDKILIVSNSSSSKELFSNQCPNISFITTPTTSYERNETEDMIQSIVDFIILSKCDLILGSYFSSFSDEASFFRIIPKITPLDKKLIDNIKTTVHNYHCINYSFIDNIAAINYNDNVFISVLDI